ncbi:hypothetical protein V7S43_004950 [Phytophthora oleae]|uniref:Glycoside hydrolase 131 catalytic N-terminal domain-containing protein n=1 Tax=Phytophthora oleae TaxID=2107226 RepID=A0ABD3FS38_9STRA
MIAFPTRVSSVEASQARLSSVVALLVRTPKVNLTSDGIRSDWFTDYKSNSSASAQVHFTQLVRDACKRRAAEPKAIDSHVWLWRTRAHSNGDRPRRKTWRKRGIGEWSPRQIPVPRRVDKPSLPVGNVPAPPFPGGDSATAPTICSAIFQSARSAVRRQLPYSAPMVFSSAIFGAAALATAYLASPAAAADEPLPWDGRGYDLTVDTLTDKYLTHILTMRNTTDTKVSDYVTVAKDGRSPAYNGDTGVVDIAVDAKAIFKAQTNFRRSELVQNVAANTKGTTFFRASVMKEDAFLNPYAWQMIFPESHIFEIRVDATASPAKIIYLNNGTWDAKWETEFVPGTWYNFGIGVSAATSGNGSVLEFYTSEGDKDLALETTHDVVTEFPSNYEFHYGLLTLSDDGSEPKMNAKQDIVSYNGVSVEADVATGATTSGAASTVASTTGSIGAESSSEVETTEAPTTQNETPATKTGIVKSSDGCARK